MKAILVLDEMPESCRQCGFLEFSKDPRYDFFCEATGSVISARDGDSKPDWCPLKELPEKLKVASDKLDELKKNNIDPNSGCFDLMADIAYESGWNDCLDEILREED